MFRYFLVAAAITAVAGSPAHAGEIFGGVYVHDIDSPLTLSGTEPGIDAQIGYRGAALMNEKGPQPYVFASVNTAGTTHFAAAGLAFKFGHRFFVRPGLGVAIHTGSARNFDRADSDRIDFGSRVLFEPELGLGYQINDRAGVEASWIHLSHGQLFGGENPGMDDVGARFTWKL